MAWIKVPDEIFNHPKIHKFMKAQRCSIHEAVGIVVLLWIWCTRYAEDGDLRKHTSLTIGMALGRTGRQAVDLVSRLTRAGFIDKSPYSRIHDWWDHQSVYLKSKYKHNVEKWMRIEKLYTSVVPFNEQSNNGTVPFNERARDVEKGRKEGTERKDVEVKNIVNKARPMTPLESASSAPTGNGSDKVKHLKPEPDTPNGDDPVSKAEVADFLKTLVKKSEPF